MITVPAQSTTKFRERVVVQNGIYTVNRYESHEDDNRRLRLEEVPQIGGKYER